MRFILTLLFLIVSSFLFAQENYKKLTPQEKAVILNKGTEAAFSGEYYQYDKEGTYLCKQCGTALYRSSDKFSSRCGWPSFDDEIEGTVKRILDRDGRRTEIVCVNCNAHLGHVFLGEQYTDKNTRHCVNSISLEFIPKAEKQDTTYFAGGCFWGVEYFFQDQKGVVSSQTGYIGGSALNPTYQLVCSKTTDYAEVVQIIFNTSETNFETLAKLFFEIHDPTQLNRQGPDVGTQYRSEIFYTNQEQKDISLILIKVLKSKGYAIKTRLTKAGIFYSAEDYHQDYYQHKGTVPYCHKYIKRF